MLNYLARYSLAVCVVTYMLLILVLHLLGLFPRAGIYDISRLIGASQTTLEGQILDSPVIRWNQTRFLMQGKTAPLDAFKGKVLVTLAYPDETLAPGDKIRVRGWLSATRSPSASREFDERGYWATKRVFSMLKVWSPESVIVIRPSASCGLTRLAWAFHKNYRKFWESVLPVDESALLLGITMGARGILPKELKEACIRAGVYHIVVVSGQNMSLIVGLGVSLLLMLQVPRRHALWICSLPIVFYTAAVGGDPPVVRAAAMALVGLLVSALGRDVPRYYPLMLAAGWILVWEPEALLGASFQLSFGATLSILAILPSLPHPDPLPKGEGGKARVRQSIRFWVRDAGLMGLTVHLGIWPLLVYYFHRLSFAGFLANWTVFPLSGILMILGLCAGTWGVFSPATVPVYLVRAIHMAVHMTLTLIERMAAGRWAVRSVTPPPWYVIGLYYGFLFGILFVVSRRPTPFKLREGTVPRLLGGRKIYAQNQPVSSAGRPRLQRR